MDRQKYVDDAFRHFVAEGHPPSVNSHGCRYRTEEGNRCAIGLQIPDARYDSLLEGRSTRTRVLLEALGLSGVMKEDSRFLTDLQRCHDGAAQQSKTQESFVALFRESLSALCTKFELTYPS